MPKRPKQHVIADQASLAVQMVIADAGFAVETVSHDYGEDLLVQTAHAGEMDASRLWFQVKGTANIERHRRADGRFGYTVKSKHALRWVRSADVVVVVLWDVRAGCGYFSTPDGEFDQVELNDGIEKPTVLSFDPDRIFTADAVKALAWRSRILRYDLLLLSALDADVDDEHANTNSLVPVLVLDFLVLVGVVERVGEDPACYTVPESVRDVLVDEGVRLEAARPETYEALFHMAAMVTVLRITQERTGSGLTRLLMHHGGRILLAALGLGKYGRELDEAMDCDTTDAALKPGRV